MALLFGDIEDAQIVGEAVFITGSNWVACAFDRDDPIVVTRLLGVHRIDALREEVEVLASASDVYDATIEADEETHRVTVVVNGTKRIQFVCRRIETTYRYYTESEARALIASLRSRVAESELRKFLSQIAQHGIELSSRP